MMGDGILLAGALLLCLAPWLYVFRRNLYVSISNDEKEKKIDENQRIMLCMTILSLILLVISAHTAKFINRPMVGMEANDNVAAETETRHGDDLVAAMLDTTPVFTYNDLIKFLLEYVGRLLITTVVFWDTILCMTVENFWHNNSRLQEHPAANGRQPDLANIEMRTTFIDDSS